MYVEFVGLPASGKSTLISRCKAFVESKGMSYASGDYLLKMESASKTIPSNIRRSPPLLSVYRSEEFRVLYPEMSGVADRLFANEISHKALFMVNAGNYLMYADWRNAQTARFIDEGFLHRGIYAIARKHSNDLEIYQDFISHMPPIDLILHTKLDPQTGYERVKDRLRNRLGPNVRQESIDTRIKRAHGDFEAFANRGALISLACDDLQERGYNVATIDTSQGIDLAVEQTIKALTAAIG